MWEERYLRYPELKAVGVIDEFYFLKKFLKELKIPKENFIKADNHKSIKDIIDRTPRKIERNIYRHFPANHTKKLDFVLVCFFCFFSRRKNCGKRFKKWLTNKNFPLKYSVKLNVNC